MQDSGLFDAPDAALDIKVDCSSPVVLHAYLRNRGLALLPAGVEVGFYIIKAAKQVKLGAASSATALFPGQVEELTFTAPQQQGSVDQAYLARVLVDKNNPGFHECRTFNNETQPARANCSLK